MKKRYILLITGLFILILSFFRFQWMNNLQNVSQLDIHNGQLALQNWDAEDGGILLLDGEWEFYPSLWIFDNNERRSIDTAHRKMTHVPDGWNDKLIDGESTPFGYGSYRLLIQVPSERQINYSLYIPSIRSASEIYVNGRLVAESGKIGTTKDDYKPKNMPITTTFTADDSGVIEIVIQAANFQDIRRSGIVRSIKFGTETAITGQRNLSFSMQIMTFVLLVIHGIYSFALYLLGNRDRRLIFFALFLVSTALMNLISSDDKLLHLLFNINYEWGFRLANILIPIIGYSLFKCIERRWIPYDRIIHPIFLAINLLSIFYIVFSTPQQIMSFIPINSSITMFSMALMVTTIVRILYKDFTRNFLLLLSILAVAHHLVWIFYWQESGLNIIHYPFDYIIAMGLFTLVWFQEYFAIHAKTKKLTMDLQQINESKDQFLANTAHEFKNPLHSIIGMSQAILIREKHLLNEQSIRELTTIVTVGQRMSILLNDLLDITNLKDENPRLQKNNMGIQPTIQGVLDMLQPLIGAKPLKMINQVPNDFPAIYADENRVVQIFYNLLHNAVKFTDTGEIIIDAQVKDGYAFISIADTGKGMDESFIKELFLPYEQEGHSEMIDGGFGLGLSISKYLVELHGGSLHVTSVPKKGSTFTFSLKLAKEAYNLKESNEPKELRADVKDQDNRISDETDHQQITDACQLPILIVDDDPINLQVLESILSAEGYAITPVLSGKEALQMLNKQDWSLVISDIMMPNMSGYELTTKIRSRYSMTELPILLLTARSESKDIETGFLVGANDYVTKPIERIEFLARVRALTTLKGSVREQLHLEAIWLQAQIQPHFLFNTLNAIIALSMIDVERMGKLLMDFSDFLKSKYRFQNQDGLLPIQEELQIVESYVNIEQVRFDKRLQVTWAIDPSVNIKDVKVPLLSIQPLVENAINHGIMKKANGGKIIISVTANGDDVIISVADNGAGMDATTVKGLLARKTYDHSSIGLINTNQRILRHFGAGIKIKSEINKGTTISFVIPNNDTDH